ncbi:MAG TPA: hypothetical protein VET89_09930 [Stellaceae bacterium]|nr:hypothetical protein [Stellaceae bacterium]
METDDTAERRARLAASEDLLARLRAQYELAMSAFKFDEARELQARVEAAEREHRSLMETLPEPSPPPAPAIPRRPRQRRRLPPRRKRRR